MKKAFQLIVIFLFFTGLTQANTGDILPTSGRIYVKVDAVGKGDGSSWDNATTLADALYWLNSNNTGSNEVWIAKGTHLPKYDVRDAKVGVTLQSKYLGFLINSDVKLYGGFVGNETKLEDRDWNVNPTILSADLNGTTKVNKTSSLVSISGNGGNVHRVLWVFVKNKVLIDGVTIFGGNASAGTYSTDVQGQSVGFNNSAAAYLSSANEKSGEDYSNGVVVFSHVIFEANNSALSGGAISLKNRGFKNTNRIYFINSLFKENTSSDNGGAIETYIYGDSYFVNTTIADNYCKVSGGGVRFDSTKYDAGKTQFFNAIVYGNHNFKNTFNEFTYIGGKGNTYGNSIIGENKLDDFKFGTEVGPVSHKDPVYNKGQLTGVPYYALIPGGNLNVTNGNKGYYNSIIEEFGLDGRDLGGNKRYGKFRVGVGAYELACSEDIPQPIVSEQMLTYSYKDEAKPLEALGTTGAKLYWFKADSNGDLDFETEVIEGEEYVVNGETVIGEALTPDTSIIGEQIFYVMNVLDTGCSSAPVKITVNVNKVILNVIPKALQYKYYGDSDPILQYSIEGGLPEGIILTGQLARKNPTVNDIATYGIEMGTLTLDKTNSEFYELAVADAVTFEIKKASVKIKLNTQHSIYYGEDEPLSSIFTYTIESIAGQGSYIAGGISGVLTRSNCKIGEPVNCISENGKDVGKYQYSTSSLVIQSGENKEPFYEVIFEENTYFEIKQAEIEITPKDLGKTYGESDPSKFEYEIKSIKGKYIFTDKDDLLTRVEGEVVGEYPYLFKEGIDDQYPNVKFTLSAKKFSIWLREILIMIKDTSTQYGMPDPVFSCEVTSEQQLKKGDFFDGGLYRDLGKNVGEYKVYYNNLIVKNEKGEDVTTSYSWNTSPLGKHTITPAALTITAVATTKVYGQNDPTDFSYTVGGDLYYGDSIEGKLKRAEPNTNNIGDYEIGKGDLFIKNTINEDTTSNYVIAYTPANFTITPATLTITATMDQSKIYGQDNPEAYTYTFTPNKLYYEDKLTGVLTRIEGEKVGSYALLRGDLKVNGVDDAQGNYDITYNSADFAITKATLTITAIATSKVYGQDDPSLLYTYTGLVSKDEISGSLVRNVGENVGKYVINQGTVNVKNTEDYTVEYKTADFEIKAGSILGISLNDNVFTYNGQSHKLQIQGSLPSASSEVKYVYKLDGVEVTEVINVGVYNVTATVTDPNYTSQEYVAELTIIQAPIVGWELKSISVVYDTKEHSLELTDTVENIDDSTPLIDGAITYTDNKRTNVGTSAVIAEVNNGPNYKPTTYKGNLTISKGKIAGLTFVDDHNTYTGKAITLKVGGLLEGDVDTYVYTNKATNIEVVEAIEVGTYVVTATVHRNNNYNDWTGLAELVIDKAEAGKMILNNTTKYYNGQPQYSKDVEGAIPSNATIVYTYTDANAMKVIDPINAGVYNVVALVSAPGYVDTRVPESGFATLTINKAVIQGVSMNGSTEVYEDREICLSVTGTIEGDTVGYEYKAETGDVSNSCPINVGRYTVTATVYRNDNYMDKVVMAELIITPAPMELLNLNDGDFSYTGTPHSLVVSKVDSHEVITDGVTFKNNGQTNAGTYTVTAIIDRGVNYIPVTLEGILSVNPAALEISAEAKQIVYGMAEPSLTYEVSGLMNGEKVEDVVTGTLTREQPTNNNVGKYVIEQNDVTANSNYKIGYRSALLEITAKELIIEVDSKTKVYGMVDPVFTYTATGLVAGDLLSGSLIRVAGENVGRFPIELGDLTAGSNYKIVYVGKNLVITQAPLAIVANEGQSKVYGDTTPEVFTYTISSGKLYYNDVFTGALARINSNNNNVGQYDIVRGTLKVNNLEDDKGNYIITYTPAIFEITRPEIANVELNSTTITYDGQSHKIQIQGDLPSDNSKVAYVYKLNGVVVKDVVNTGVYDVTATVIDPNYKDLVLTAQLNITAKSLTVIANAGQFKIYGEEDSVFTYDVTGLIMGEKLTGSLERKTGEDIGMYTIEQGSLSASTNYVVQYFSSTFEIKTRDLIVKANNQTKVYGVVDPIFTYSVTGLIGVDLLNGSLTRVMGENVGTYSIELGNLTAGKNYVIVYKEANLVITQATLIIKANEVIKIYGDVEPVLTYEVEGLVNSDMKNIIIGGLERELGENIGTYTIEQGSLSASDNYVIDYRKALLEIRAKNLIIKADRQTKVYGEKDPILSYSVGELIGEDVVSGFLTRVIGEDVGMYTIEQGSLSVSDNYVVDYRSSILEITAKELIIEVDPQTKVYGMIDPVLTYKSTGLEEKDIIVGSLERENGEDVGMYEIYVGTLSAGTNYFIIFNEKNLSITSKELIVEANPKTKVYGDVDPAFTYDVTGLVGEDKLIGGLERKTGEDVGVYTIEQGSLSAGTNYLIDYKEASLVVTQASLAIVANEGQSKVYGDTTPEVFTYRVSSGKLYHGDVFTGGLTRKDANNNNVGQYEIMRGTLKVNDLEDDKGNYVITYTPAIFEITRPEITNVELNSATITYDGQSHKLQIQGDLPSDNSKIVYVYRLNGVVVKDVINTGVYDVTATVTDPNYKDLVLTAQLNITAKSLIVIANASQFKAYGDVDPVFTYDVTGLVGEDKLIGGLERKMGEDVGTYTIEQGSLSASANYVIQYLSSIFEIKAKKLIVKATSQTKVYGMVDPIFTYSVTGLIGGDLLNGSLTRVIGEDVGTYTIEQGSLSSGDNYVIVYEGADFFITKAKQEILGLEKVIVVNFDETNSYELPATSTGGLAIEYSYSNMVPSNLAIGTSTGQLTFYNTGTMDVTAYQAGNGNYESVSVTQRLEVEGGNTEIYELIVDGVLYENIDENTTIPLRCLNDNQSINIEVVVDEKSQVEGGDKIEIQVIGGKPIINPLYINVIANSGLQQLYTITFDVADDTSKILVTKNNNVIFVNNNSQTNGGFTFKSYKVFEDDKLISAGKMSGQGESIANVMSDKAYYYAELITENDELVVTCLVQFTRKHEGKLEVYPNPVRQEGKVTVRYDEPNELFGTAQYKFYTLQGQMVDYGVLKNNLSTIKMKQNLSTGTYFLVLKHKDKQKTFTIIIKN